jgi:hypothetical protein
MVEGVLFVGKVDGRWVASPLRAGAFEMVPVEAGASFYEAVQALHRLFPETMVVAAMLEPAA